MSFAKEIYARSHMQLYSIQFCKFKCVPPMTNERRDRNVHKNIQEPRRDAAHMRHFFFSVLKGGMRKQWSSSPDFSRAFRTIRDLHVVYALYSGLSAAAVHYLISKRH